MLSDESASSRATGKTANQESRIAGGLPSRGQHVAPHKLLQGPQASVMLRVSAGVVLAGGLSDVIQIALPFELVDRWGLEAPGHCRWLVNVRLWHLADKRDVNQTCSHTKKSSFAP